MATNPLKRQVPTPERSVIQWLLDSDPSIRWQVMRDLTDAPDEGVAAERAKVATEGWGARLLALQDEDGQWVGGALFPARRTKSDNGEQPKGQPWTATAYSLVLLRDFGVDPRSPQLRRALAQVREHCRWEHAGQPFFAGEVEPCINGMTVALGAYFDQDVDGVVARLVGEQLEDGGWNCEVENGSVRSSFHTTIRVLEGLLAHERATGGSAESIAARRRGEEYLLERKLFRRRSTGEVVDPAWLQFSFPTRWHYDVLRALEYFRAAGDPPDPRADEAIDLLRSKQQPDGTWLLENTHPGAVHFALEDGDGRPSRWNTLRALRVLDWYSPHLRHSNKGYKTSVTKGDRPVKVTVETVVKADLNAVWRAWNNPEDIKQWNAASDDWHTTKSAVDLREDGSFSSRMEAKDGSEGFDFEGTYTRIVPQKLIEYRLGDGRNVEVQFTNAADGVLVRETFEAESENEPEVQRQGWQAILDKFARHVEAKATVR